MRRIATLPVGRALLVLLIAECALVVFLVTTGRIIGDVAWFLGALALTSTLLLLSIYDVTVEVMHAATNTKPGATPELFKLTPSLAKSSVVTWLKPREKHLSWLLFGAGIVAGHLWWH